MMKRIMSIFLVVALCFTMLPGYTAAAEHCHHHEVHTDTCGYVAAVPGSDCTHSHDGSCGYIEAVSEVPCACAADESGALVHTEGCGYVAPIAGADCTHAHDGSCGFTQAVSGSECTYFAGGCPDCAAEAAAASETTGATEAAEEVTNPTVETTEPATEPAEEIAEPPTETTEPSTEETEPAPVCDCSTDDASIHATNCPVYVTPENPECFCVEKCTEPNLWCDICGFDATACEGGEDEAVVYASVTSLTFGGTTIVSDGTVQTASGEGWNYDSETNTLYITDDVTISTGDVSALVSEGGGLNIHIASEKTLSLTGNQNTVVLNGNSTISGGGSMTVTGGYGGTRSVYVTGSLDISNITLSATATATGGNAGVALISIGQMTFENVTATIEGQVHAGGSPYHPVSISGSSTISIYSSGNSDGALSAGELTLSNTSHLKVWTDSSEYLICANHHIPIPVSGGYYRTGSGGEFVVGTDPVTLGNTNRYFEYIGAGHVGEVKQNSDGTTHGKSCTCSIAAVVESKACSGGTATCMEKAVCTDCEGEYGEVNPNNHTGTSYTDGFRNCCGEFEPATGNGTEDALYQISNAGQLLWFAQQVNSGNTAISGKLMNSIDLSGIIYTPIGTTTYPYTGTFDGQGYSIKNMVINSTAEYQGLFGVVGAGVTIQNIVIDASCSVSGGDFTAAIVGGSVRYASGEVTIENCINYANVIGGMHTGGIFGGNTGDDATVIIRNCANLGNITGGTNCGTIAGYLGTTTVGTLENCWNTGTLTATSGDSFAHLDAATIINCYNLNTLPASTKEGVSTFTAEELVNGALAYKLGTPWGQTIDTNNHPVLNGKAVYYGYISCGTDAVMVYSNNSSASEEKPAHTGGTATCTEQAVCTVCGESYGELGGDHIDENKDHSCDRSCGYVSEHTGGTATCTEKAVCTVCDESYGETNPNNHAGTSYTDGFRNCCGEFEPATGSGTESDPYQIGNAGQLYWFAQRVNLGVNDATNVCYADLTADINLNGRKWYPIGLYNDPAYEGGDPIEKMAFVVFDGQGHTVSNFTASGNGSQGLFGYCAPQITTVENIGVENATISGWNAAGVIAYGGNIKNSWAKDCTITIATTSETSVVSAGPVAGYNTREVLNCYAYNCTITVGDLPSTVKTYYIIPVGGRIEESFMNVENNYYYNVAVTGNVNTDNNGFRGTDGATEATAAQFASGEIAYKLNGSTSEGDLAWGQTCGAGLPTLGGAAVYQVLNCKNENAYSNTNENLSHNWKNGVCTYGCGTIHDPHTYENGTCTVCGASQSIVSVDISWGAMEFTYSDGTWNPETHSYEGGGWTAVGNTITVVNNGNVDVKATARYDYYIDLGCEYIWNASEAILTPDGDNKQFTFVLSFVGKPNQYFEKRELGIVHIQISRTD